MAGVEQTEWRGWSRLSGGDPAGNQGGGEEEVQLVKRPQPRVFVLQMCYYWIAKLIES